MKASLLTLLLIFSSLSITMAQKKYMVKVTTLDNKVYKGLMFQVRDNDFLIVPRNVRWNPKVKEDNIPRAKAIDFRLVKEIKIRKKGSFEKGFLIGLGVGIVGGVIIIKSFKPDKTSSNDITGFSALAEGIGVLLKAVGIITVTGSVGGIIGSSYPHQFEVKKDSTSIQSLKIELKKYEWYHAEEGMTNNK
jgi:hypothetical protein